MPVSFQQLLVLVGVCMISIFCRHENLDICIIIYVKVKLFCNLLTRAIYFSGFALWHVTSSWILTQEGVDEFLRYYSDLALPIACVYYLLFVVVTVAVLDRYAIAVTHCLVLHVHV